MPNPNAFMWLGVFENPGGGTCVLGGITEPMRNSSNNFVQFANLVIKNHTLFMCHEKTLI